MRPQENSPGYLPTLDGWRAIAIAGVLLVHSPDLPRWTHLHRYLQIRGVLGVNLFFAISGFLICSRLLGEERVRGNISLKAFYIRRAFRILPAAIVFLLTVAILGGLHVIPFDESSWFGALFFYRNYIHYFQGATSCNWFTSHFWSLSVEEHFYLLLPGIMVFFPLRRRAILLLLSALSMLWLCGFLYGVQGAVDRGFWGQRTEFMLPALLLPAAYAMFLQKPDTREAVRMWLRPLVGVVLAVAAGELTMHIMPLWAAPFPGLVLAAVFPLLIVSTMLHPHHAFSRLLEWEPLRWVGRLSYSLYLWQELFLPREHRYPMFPIHWVQTPAIAIPSVVLCAVLSYYLIERPCIRFGQRLTGRRTAVPSGQLIPPIERG